MRAALRAGLHVAALWAIAVAQPLFDLLGKNAEFFAVRDLARLDIVLFGVGLVVLPPAAIVLAEWLTSLVHQRLADGLHLFVVGGLAALVVLQAESKATDLLSLVLVPAGAVAGTGAAFVYARFALARTFVSVLAPVPLIFLGLFFFASPAGRLVREGDPEPRTFQVSSTVPVVVLVFDEISTVSLLDAGGEIDARRFPNFAALARDATWFRNAATVDAWTTNAVPAILTGVYPKHGRLPVYSEHPDNLFTLLGASYRLQVSESLTQLCPRSLCSATARRPFSGRMQELFSDAGLVYLHLALPRDLRRRLPSVSDTWGAFLESSHERTRRRLSLFHRFAASVDGAEQPTLAFAHVMLPHIPWEFLPSGRRYDGADLPGFETNRWGSDSFLVEQGYQRYLLQLGFADRLLGDLVRRLRTTGLYDRALLIVVADHGVSFRPGGRRRAFTAENLEDVVFMPLLVKRPGQEEGRVVDDPVQTVDILPTVAAELGVRVPWQTDGGPLFGHRSRDRYLFVGDRGSFTATPAPLLARRDAALRRQTALFGSGLYRIGPEPELLGRRIGDLTLRPSGSARAELDQASDLRTVDLEADEVPARLTGTVSGEGGSGRDLAVALNGIVAATARSYSLAGEERFSVLVPEAALRDGSNEAGLFWVLPGNELVPLLSQ